MTSSPHWNTFFSTLYPTTSPGCNTNASLSASSSLAFLDIPGAWKEDFDALPSVSLPDPSGHQDSVDYMDTHSYDPVNDRNFCSDEAGILVYDHAASWALAPGDMHVASDERKEICSLPSSPTMQRHEAPVRPAAPPSSSVATPVLCSTSAPPSNGTTTPSVAPAPSFSESKIVVVFPALDSASAPSSNQTTPPSVAPAQSFPDPWTIATHPVLCSASAPSSTETTTPSLAPVPSPAEPSIAATPAPAPAKSSLYGVRRAPCTPASRSKLKGPVTFQAPTVLLTPGVAPESTWTEPAFPPSPEDPVAPPLRQVDFLYTLDEEGYADKCGFSWRVKVSPQRQSSYLRVKVLQTMGFRDLMGTCREKARKIWMEPLSLSICFRTALGRPCLVLHLLSPRFLLACVSPLFASALFASRRGEYLAGHRPPSPLTNAHGRLKRKTNRRRAKSVVATRRLRGDPSRDSVRCVARKESTWGPSEAGGGSRTVSGCFCPTAGHGLPRR